MDVSRDGKDGWKTAAILLGVLDVLLAAAMAALLLFGGGGGDTVSESHVEKKELAASAPHEKGREAVSEITVTGSEVPKAAEPAKPENASTGPHRYEIISQRMTWQAAKAYCEDRGGYLAVVTDQAEYETIVAAAQASGRKVLWLGAQKDGAGSFGWITGENFSYAPWLAGEPNNEGGNEDSLVMFLVNSQWVWSDVPSDLSPYYKEDIVGLNKIAARWPAQTVAQFYFLKN